MTVASWLRRCRAWYPDRAALVSGTRRYTYAEFGARVNRHANALTALGLRPGDRVAVVTNNDAEAVEALGACAVGGFVHVPISFRLTAREVAHIIDHSESRVLLLARSHAERLVDAAASCPSIERVIVFDPDDAESSEYEAWLREAGDAQPAFDATADTDLFICYTSGTTGAPKGVLFAHRQIVAHAPVPTYYYGLGPDSRLLVVYPHNSIACIAMFYTPAWMLGATVILSDARNFSAERWLKEVEREQVTHCHLVPTMLFRVLESERLAASDTSSLQTVGYGSAPMPRERVERLGRVFGNILVQGYGMTEVTSLAAVLTKADHAEALAGGGERLGACGRPVFGTEIRLVDEDGRDVPTGEVGEIVFRGPQVTSGYWRDPERTAQALRGGWLHSGDMARQDEAGFLYMVDRKSDIIISGGVNIASKEVEEVIYWMAGVHEVAVVGRPDKEWGERVHAFVVPDAGVALVAAEVIAFCRERLAKFKCPDVVEFLDELPRNALGKFIKSELRARARSR